MSKTTEVVFILDRSGSMAGLESDTIGGFNGMLEKQKELEGRAYLTTALFDDRYELLHDHIDIRKAEKLTEKQYYVRGCTALLDAVGYTIQKIAHEKDEDSQVIMIITTDGYENASHEYTYASLKKLIEKKKKEGWEFIFLGANIDAAPRQLVPSGRRQPLTAAGLKKSTKITISVNNQLRKSLPADTME